MRYLALDLGDRRTGVAFGDDETGVVTPGHVIEMPMQPGDMLIEAIKKAVEENGPGVIVVGLPINMDGSEGQRAKITRVFAERVGEAVGLPMEMQDERLTSAEANWTMARSGMTRKQKKRKRDALAAANVLRDYLARECDEGDGEG